MAVRMASRRSAMTRVRRSSLSLRPVAAACRFLCHLRPLAVVAVSSRAHDGGDAPVGAYDFAYRVEDVDERVGCVGVVHDGGYPFRRAESLEASRHRDEAAHVDEHFTGVEACED